MVDKNEVKEFFDSLASSWDADMVIREDVIGMILNNACISQGSSVLDVACGTGVLVPFYLNRGITDIVGIDISPKMIEIAQSKFASSGIRFVCGDAETLSLGRAFDRIVVYNAFPHFADSKKLIENLCSMLSDGGILTIAHGMSREAVNKHHTGVRRVSNGLAEIEEIVSMGCPGLSLIKTVSDEKMFQLCWKKY